MLLVLQILGGAVVLETAIQIAWYSGLCRFWRPRPPKPLQCDEIVKWKDDAVTRCVYDIDHHGPHKSTRGGLEDHYWHTKGRFGPLTP